MLLIIKKQISILKLILYLIFNSAIQSFNSLKYFIYMIYNFDIDCIHLYNTLLTQFQICTLFMEEDEQLVKQIMNLLGSRKKLSYKGSDGKVVKLQIGNSSEDQNDKNSNNLEDLGQQMFSNQYTAPSITPKQKRKVTLKPTLKKVQANQAVLNFMCQTEKNIKVQQPQVKTNPSKTVEESLLFLRSNHPQDRDHLDLITQRMTQLQKIQQEKMKLQEDISSILSSSFSRSFDPSADISVLSMIGATNSDPLCQIFNSYIRKTVQSKKTQQDKAPSFLFLYSQPMIDQKGQQIDDQINYFDQQASIQKILNNCNINYIRQRATMNKLHYWVKQQVSIMHFCGHGVQAEKNYLLFQSVTGQSVKMDAEILHKILYELNVPLKLVFVASCHSESTGKIFSEAGAQHVICVKDNHQILDEICQQFVKIFYYSCIKDKMSICQSFTFSKKQLILSGKFKSHECEKFILLKNHRENQCVTLSIQNDSCFNDLTPKPFFSKSLPSRVQNYIPRPRDLHEILKLLDNKRRFITITGYAGMGKSTLVRQLVRYIQFRDFFRDGVIYSDLRNCQNLEKVLETLNLQIFETGQVKLNKKIQQNIQRLIKQLFDRHVLIVFDNCQSVMSSNNREDFKDMIETIMKKCVNIYFVFTHRHSIGRQIDYCSEKLYELKKLNQVQSERLFFSRVPRNIEKKQLEEFFALQQTKIGKHPFFQFLNGHPQAICMTASLLSERSLSQLYDLLMKPCIKLTDSLSELEEGDKAGKVVQTAMKISLNVLKNKHKQASEMIKYLSLLPRGLDSYMMSRIFGPKWKQNVKKLIHHSLVQCVDAANNSKYYTVHPLIIMYVNKQMGNEEKNKYHQKICDKFAKRIQKCYENIGTISQSAIKEQQQFLNEEINYQSIIYRQLGFYGDNLLIKKLYNNLFKTDYLEEEELENQKQMNIKGNAIQQTRKKIVYKEKILQETKKSSITVILVYYVTNLFVMKNFPACKKFIEVGIKISRAKNNLIIEANLLRIAGCLDLVKNQSAQARQNFYNSWILYALQGCGLGSASCEAAIGYLRFIQQQYAMAKKNLENALKYYDQIPHAFGKHYLNRWLCSLKSKINREQNQLLSHRQQAQKLLKQAKISLKSHNINNTQLIRHKLGIFVFRFTFDNISLFLQASFQVDVKPKIINEPVKKNMQDAHDQMLLSSINKEAYKKYPAKK